MASKYFTQLTNLAAGSVSAYDALAIEDISAGETKYITAGDLASYVEGGRIVRFLVSNPQAYYTQRPQIVLMRSPFALTITTIIVVTNSWGATGNIAGDLKFADDVSDGSFANSTLIRACDTTDGVLVASSGFGDATVPSAKFIYLQLDSSPGAAVKDFYIEFYFTVD